MATTPRTRSLPSAISLPPTEVHGLRRSPFEDVYHQVLVRPWWQFYGGVLATFLLANTVFALLYHAVPGCISHVDDFEDAFFFSVQTLGTIGYGTMAPTTRFGHLVVTVEAIFGILFVALITGLTFAKFSRPRARVLFSEKIAAPTRFGVPFIQFRMANTRGNMVIEANLRAILLIAETTPEGEITRRPVEIKLVRSSTALFALTWTAMHEIDASSPFFGEGAMDRLRAQRAEIFLSLTGYDETIAQTIHARQRYALDDIVWGHRFRDVLEIREDLTRVIHYEHFHDTVPINQTGQTGQTGETGRAGPTDGATQPSLPG